MFRICSFAFSHSHFVSGLVHSSQAESASRVVRLATVANNRLKKHGPLAKSTNTIIGCICCILKVLNRTEPFVIASCCSASPLLGLSDPLLSKMARCGKSKLDSHICRNLHTTVRKFSKAMPVNLSSVRTSMRLSRKRPQEVPVQHPVLHLSDWVECIFNRGGHFFLGGQSLDHAEQFREVLVDYWEKYHAIDPGFNVPRSQWNEAIPIALHGDEGRGRQKLPVMVMAAQTIIPLFANNSNMAGTFSFAYSTLYKLFNE